MIFFTLRILEELQYLDSGTIWHSYSDSWRPTSSRCCRTSRQSPPGQRTPPRGRCSSQRWARGRTWPGLDRGWPRWPSRATWGRGRPWGCPRRGRWRRWSGGWAWGCRTIQKVGRRGGDRFQTMEDKTVTRLHHWEDLEEGKVDWTIQYLWWATYQWGMWWGPRSWRWCRLRWQKILILHSDAKSRGTSMFSHKYLRSRESSSSQLNSSK